MIIDLSKFIAKREASWKELDRLAERYEQTKGKGWSMESIERFNALYRSACTDLVEAQTFANDNEMVRFLEKLVARSYAQIYSKRRRLFSKGILYWAFAGFPLAFRRHFRFFLASLIVTMAGAAIGGFLLVKDPHAKESLFQGFGHLMGDPSERVAREERSGAEDEVAGHYATFSGQLMTHNIRVSLLAVSLGLLWGVGTLALLFYNGAILGAVCVDYIQSGEGLFLTGWLLPHGSIEIPAILIAGQGGFILANALIGWGSSESIGQRFARIRDDVAYLVGGIGLMLVWAGIVESYFSQTHEPRISYEAKIAGGVTELVLLMLFLVFGDRVYSFASSIWKERVKR